MTVRIYQFDLNTELLNELNEFHILRAFTFRTAAAALECQVLNKTNASFPLSFSEADNNNPYIEYVIPKSDLDLAYKDEQCRIFPSNFEVIETHAIFSHAIATIV